MTTLFVNACMRGEDSRTLALCREYLQDKEEVVEVDLATLGLKPFDAQMVAYRTEKQKAKAWDDPIFDLSHQFTEDARCEGICKADRLTYIASCGGFVEGANFGYEYFCGIAKMFGIPETRFVAAEGLDIVGIDVEAQMDKARAQIAALD